MRTLGNILWHFPFFGFLFALAYFIWGIICCITIIFIPVGKGFMQFSGFLMSPFKNEMVSESDLIYLGRKEKSNLSKGYNLFLKILYFPFGLFNALALIFLIAGEFISIIGIPSAIVWAKSLGTIFCPIGKVRVSKAEAELIRKRKAEVENPYVTTAATNESTNPATATQIETDSKYALNFSIIDYIKSDNPTERLRAVSVIIACMLVISTLPNIIFQSSIRLIQFVDLTWIVDAFFSPTFGMFNIILDVITNVAFIAWFCYMIKYVGQKKLLKIPVVIGLIVIVLKILQVVALHTVMFKINPELSFEDYRLTNYMSSIILSVVLAISYVSISTCLKNNSLSKILLVCYCITSVIALALHAYNIVEPLQQFVAIKPNGTITSGNTLLVTLDIVINMLLATFMYIFSIEKKIRLN